MKRLIALLLMLSICLGMLPAALAEDIRISFTANRFTYTCGESTEITLKANAAPKSDLTLTLADSKKNTYTVVLPAGQTEARLTVSTPLSANGSTTTFTLQKSSDYLRVAPYETAVVARGAAMFSFGASSYITYVDRDLSFKVRVSNPDRLEKGTLITLRDQDGNVVESFEHAPSRQSYSFTFHMDESWRPGKTLSVWVDGREEADASALMAVGITGSKSIYGVKRNDQKIAFTMDAGSAGENTPTILDILDKYNVKITFFVTGKFASAYPDYVKEMHARGHEIGNHSWSHPSFYNLSNDQILSEVNRTRDKIYELTGVTTTLFRPPLGDMNTKIRTLLNAAGYEVIRWTHESYDSRDGHSAEKSLKYATKDLFGGAIILTHVKANWTVSVLDQIMQYYQENGWEVVPVSELLYDGETAVDEDGLQYQIAP